jgi:hypothetical protein
MVWAINQDLDDGRFFIAVGNAAGCKFCSLLKQKRPYGFEEEVNVGNGDNHP